MKRENQIEVSDDMLSIEDFYSWRGGTIINIQIKSEFCLLFKI